MISFSPLYTGRDSAVKLPELDALERASQKKNELIVRAEEKKLDQFIKDKEHFRELMKVDPVAARSMRNTAKQAEALEDYKNFAARKYAETNGRLSMADELAIMSKKELLQAKQNKILSDEKRIADAEARLQRDATGKYYDKEKFRKLIEDYDAEKIDELPQVLLQVKPRDITPALSADKSIGTSSTYMEPVKDESGKDTGYVQEYTTLRNPEEGKITLINNAMHNEPYMLSLIEQFSKAPDTDKYLMDYDTSPKNGILDPEEKDAAMAALGTIDEIDTNHPLWNWAMDQPLIRKAAMGAQKPITKKVPSKGKTTEESGWKTFLNDIKYPVTEPAKKDWGAETYNTYHEIPKEKTINILVNDYKLLNSKGNRSLREGKTIKLAPTGYDEETDEFTFKIMEDYKLDGTEGRGDQIAIKRTLLDPKLFGNFNVMVDGSPVAVSDIKRAAPAPTPTSKKKIFKDGKWIYPDEVKK